MAKTLALVFGVILVLVGLLGFVSNPLVGVGALFVTNGTLDVLYVILGIVLIGCALRMAEQAGLWLKIVGAIYVVLGLLGLFIGSPVLGLFDVSGATNWLHIILGIVLLAAGYWGGGEMESGMGATGGMNPPGGAM